MTLTHHPHSQSRHARPIDPLSLAVLFVCLVAIALMLVGIAARGTTPIVLIAPTLLGCVAIAGLRR